MRHFWVELGAPEHRLWSVCKLPVSIDLARDYGAVEEGGDEPLCEKCAAIIAAQALEKEAKPTVYSALYSHAPSVPIDLKINGSRFQVFVK